MEEELKDIKYFLLKNQKGEISTPEAFEHISELIKVDGHYVADDIMEAFDLGKADKEFNIISKDNVLEQFKNDVSLDNLVNYIGENGFFSLEDIKKFYEVGKNNKSSETKGDKIRDFFFDGFKTYLTTDYSSL